MRPDVTPPSMSIHLIATDKEFSDYGLTPDVGVAFMYIAEGSYIRDEAGRELPWRNAFTYQEIEHKRDHRGKEEGFGWTGKWIVELHEDDDNDLHMATVATLDDALRIIKDWAWRTPR